MEARENHVQTTVRSDAELKCKVFAKQSALRMPLKCEQANILCYE